MLDLQKKLDLSKKVVLDLTKRIGIEGQHAQVVLCLDYSGSMSHLYRNGHVQKVLERIVPVAMAFDDNGEMEMFLFENSSKRHPNNVTNLNVGGIVEREILGKYRFGGTSYAPPIKMLLNEVTTNSVETSAGGGFFGLFKKGPSTYKAELPTYVIFITDGENSDHEETKSIIRKASHAPVFFQFVGIGNERFKFLKALDNLDERYIDNANFFQINNLLSITDEELYSKLLTEFPSWLKESKTKNLL